MTASNSQSKTPTDRQELTRDRQRPRYHFQPPANWMNDPNGVIQWQGQYHLFYQYNPLGPWHERIHWGHAVSDDLVHWRDLPVVLAPTDGGPDEEGCWSGCAVDLGEEVALFYTGVHPQVVCTARSSDPDLRTWRKAAAPLIETPPSGIHPGSPADFRDPFVWREDDGWYMVIGSRKLGEGGLVLLYRSDNLRTWTYLHPLFEGDLHQTVPFWPGTMWECPNFFYLDGTPVLVVSVQNKAAGDLLYPAYYAGSLRAWRLVPQQSGKIDHGGSFYAPLTMVDDRERRLMWGWLQENRSQDAYQAAGWAGVMSLPRELFLHADGSLGQRPVSELETLRGAHWQTADVVLDADTPNPLAATSGDRLELGLTWEPDVQGILELAVRCSTHGEEGTYLRYDANTQTLSVDRTRSSLNADVTQDVRSAPLLLDGEALDLRVFLDGSVVEIFANERVCFASRIYPIRSDSLGLGLGGSGRVRQLDVWQIESIW